MLNFQTAWLNTFAGSGMAWSQSTGCFLIIYGYVVSGRETFWSVLLAHAVSGFFGTMIENVFIAKRMCCLDENWALLLGLNEINWIIHESSSVAYSMLKLQIVVQDDYRKKMLHYSMALLFLPFVGFRVLIGYFRTRDNTTGNEDIQWAHSMAFIFWGIADLILFCLLVMVAYQKIRDHEAGERGRFIFMSLLKSSVPRISVLVINTFVIVALGQILTEKSQMLNNLNTLAWQSILLFDLLITRGMVQGSKRKSVSEASNLEFKSKQYTTN
ncbi:hypothetical protein EDD86DRAFT_249308 [Gorgonomyces haynaldii]|nr:hypothetical protein EDD86DRAFT_249308 [Gorgonomyces haynaldii]